MSSACTMCLCLHLESSWGCNNWMLKALENISHKWWLEYLCMHWQKKRGKVKINKCVEESRGVGQVLKEYEEEEEVRVGVFFFPCRFSATSAPLANQQIPLLAHFGLEHSQNIHPFLSNAGMKDVLAWLSPTWTPASSSLWSNNECSGEKRPKLISWEKKYRIKHSKVTSWHCEIKNHRAAQKDRQKKGFISWQQCWQNYLFCFAHFALKALRTVHT